MTDGIAHPQPHVVGNMRTAVERNLTPRHALEQQNDISGGLNDLIRRWRVHGPRNSRDETMCRGVFISPMRQLTFDSFRACPRLVRKFPIWRIDDDTTRGGRQKILS